jgi:hypothetical protein
MFWTPLALNLSYCSTYPGTWELHGGVNAPGTPIYYTGVVSVMLYTADDTNKATHDDVRSGDVGEGEALIRVVFFDSDRRERGPRLDLC